MRKERHAGTRLWATAARLTAQVPPPPQGSPALLVE